MGRSLGKDAYRPPAPAGRGARVRGARSSFVLRRMGFARLLPASLLLAILTATTVTTALASFGIRALPGALHRRLARTEDTSIQVSGQIGAARATADTPVITSTIRSALGRVPVTVVSGRWSDQLALPKPRGASQPPLLQAAVLDDVTAHAELTAGGWPGPRRPGQPIEVALPATTASMLHLPVGTVLALPDSLTGTTARLRVTGLFRPRDAAAAYWRLSLLGTSGKLIQGSFVTYGPMLVNPDALGPGGLGVSAASWLLTVDTARITPGSSRRAGPPAQQRRPLPAGQAAPRRAPGGHEPAADPVGAGQQPGGGQVSAAHRLTAVAAAGRRRGRPGRAAAS